MAKSSVTTTTIEELRIAPKVQRALLTELEGYQSLHSEMKACKDGADAHRNQILTIVDGASIDAEKFEIEGFKVAVVRGALDRRLDKQALLKRLVKDGKYSLKAATALLADCTTEKPKKDHVRVTAPGEESGDE